MSGAEKKMENAEIETIRSSSGDDKVKSERIGDGEMPQGAVDIVDFYATTSDARKQSECSDSTVPVPPSRKQSSSEPISPLLLSAGEGSDPSDSPPSKPSRRVSQISNGGRKFSVSSNSSANRTPKKVSFSDELPFTDQLTLASGSSSDAEQTIRLTSDYLETLKNAIEGNRGVSSEEGSAPSTPVNELSVSALFPNTRKMSIHSERSVDAAPASILKPNAEPAASPMDTFIDQERRNSTSSQKSDCCEWLRVASRSSTGFPVFCRHSNE